MDRIAGITSNTVPWEILRAAGYAPRLLDGVSQSSSESADPTPYADRFMEAVFAPHLRVIFDRLCSGAWSDIEVVVIPRTSEQEHKLYLYLREAQRTRQSVAIPWLYLYNLLHTRTSESYDYGLERTRQMVRDFEVSGSALLDAIAESNQARGVVRQILQKRREGLLDGSAALPLLRSFYTEDRCVFASRAQERLHALDVPVASNRPRILIQGALPNDLSLHQTVEAAGGYVIAEDDWRGSRAAGDHDIGAGRDPVTAIFEKYFYDEVSPRIQPAAERDAWFERQIREGYVDGVLFSIPPEDDVAGWDYPRLLAWLDGNSVPSIPVRGSRSAAEIARFIGTLTRESSRRR